MGIQDQGFFVEEAVDWLLNDYFLLGVPIAEVLQVRKPYDLFRAWSEPLILQGGCGVLEVEWNTDENKSHVVTMYNLVRSSYDNDPRSIYRVYLADSDDDLTDVRSYAVKYKPGTRKHDISLLSGEGKIRCWYSFQHVH